MLPLHRPIRGVVSQSADGLVARLESNPTEQRQWLRYFHRWPTQAEWDSAAKGNSLNQVDPYSSGLITDFYAYDCYITTGSGNVYEQKPRNSRWAGTPPFVQEYESGSPLSNFMGALSFGERGIAGDGLHWVGDLIVESDVDTSSSCQGLVLEIVEAGIQYQCQINLTNGMATLGIIDGENTHPFDSDAQSDSASPQAETALRAGDSFSVRFSNCDDQLLLWINDQLVAFDRETTFDSKVFRSEQQCFPHYKPGIHPLDAAPVGIAVQGGSATVKRVKIDRDKYYVATDDSRFGIFDYDHNQLSRLAQQSVGLRDVQAVLRSPGTWDKFPMWQTRRKVSFELQEDQFFPMGDNSPESLDARCWAGTKLGPRLPKRYRDQAYAFADASYVPRDLLVGKALLVFWPHPWNSPVPFTPNFERFRLIR